MPSIRGFARSWALPAVLAGVLAVLGGAGIAAWRDSTDESYVVVVDFSPSCLPPAAVRGDIRFDDGNLAAALARAAARPGVGRILLYTDAVFDRAPTASKPVAVVLRPRRDAFLILQIRAPDRVPVGVDFSVEIEVGRTAGPGQGAVEAHLTLFRGDERVGAESYAVRLERGQKRTIRIRDRVPSGGPVHYRARLAGGEERERVVRIGDRTSVLAIGGGRPVDGFVWLPMPAERVEAYLARRDVGRGVDVILLRGGLESTRAQKLVADAVRGGAGLVVAGGIGFSDRPLETVLPLTDKPPGGRAALLLLDFSGSMERWQPQMRRAVALLMAAFSPRDQIAFVAFRDEVVAESDWTTVADANWNLQIRSTGNTSLVPALLRAAERLENAPSAHKRLFVVSDGEWSDVADASETMKRFAGIYVAALFVEKRVHKDLFPTAFVAGDDFAATLRKAEDEAPDRRIEGTVSARRGDVADWLRDAAPVPGVYEVVARLYPRGAGERIALRADEIPLVGTLEPGGRVVMTAVKGAPLGGLLRAAARRGADVVLLAERDGAGLRLSARAAQQEVFLVDGKTVAGKPAGPGRWSAHVEHVSSGALQVRFGAAIHLVPPASDDEMGGLTNRPDIAADIARLSGGQVHADGVPPAPGRGRTAVYATFLAAAACVVWSALKRRAA